MKVSIGKLVLVCGAVLIVLVLVNVFIVSMPSAGDIGDAVFSALDRGNTSSQTSVQICAGFLNIGSCRSTQTMTGGWRAPSSGFTSLPVLLIFAAAGLSVVFLAWIVLWLAGSEN